MRPRPAPFGPGYVTNPKENHRDDLPESVLISRNASLGDMVALLQRQHDAKLNVVVPARDMRMTDGDLHIDGIGEPTITLDGVTPARGVFCPTVTACR